MKTRAILPAWGRILRGYRPFLSVEITKECPLRCPGCYAYIPGHVGEGASLADVSDLRGDELVEAVIELVRRHRPLHLSIVGGEPLVRYRELDALLPRLAHVEVQLITSAVRPVPLSWSQLPQLHLVVSVDGLPAEHDKRRFPATYDRVLRNIAGHRLIVHCTVTRQMLARPGYLHEFAAFWSERIEARKLWFSLYTPQEGEQSGERLTTEDRVRAVEELRRLRTEFPKVHMPESVLQGYLAPPASPRECIFAETTTSISADLATRIDPCPLGGRPVCGECGCMGSAGMASVGRYKLAGLIPLSSIFTASRASGKYFEKRRNGTG